MMYAIVPLDFDPAQHPSPRLLWPLRHDTNGLADGMAVVAYPVRYHHDRQAVFPDGVWEERPGWSVTAAHDPFTGVVVLFGNLPPELAPKPAQEANTPC